MSKQKNELVKTQLSLTALLKRMKVNSLDEVGDLYETSMDLDKSNRVLENENKELKTKIKLLSNQVLHNLDSFIPKAEEVLKTADPDASLKRDYNIQRGVMETMKNQGLLLRNKLAMLNDKCDEKSKEFKDLKSSCFLKMLIPSFRFPRNSQTDLKDCSAIDVSMCRHFDFSTFRRSDCSTFHFVLLIVRLFDFSTVRLLRF